eukprot:4409973-Amphidinium_carterae.1
MGKQAESSSSVQGADEFLLWKVEGVGLVGPQCLKSTRISWPNTLIQERGSRWMPAALKVLVPIGGEVLALAHVQLDATVLQIPLHQF